MGRQWQELSQESVAPNVPPLIIKHEVENSSYTIYVSDLIHIWTEHLSAKDIRRRALNSNTSIDPSEDHDQMRHFLRCVDDALAQKAGTSINLTYNVNADRLLLRTETALPGSLEPLKWNIELKMESTFVLTREVVVPLLLRQAVHTTESASLFQQLKEKDHVIDKLIDAMIADGLSLTKVFPGGAPSKSALKSNPRQAWSKNARGLSEFNEQQWHRDLNDSATRSSHFRHLVATVFPKTALIDHESISLPEYDEWWLSMRNHGLQDFNVSAKPQSQIEENQGTDGESQFQVPKLQSNEDRVAKKDQRQLTPLRPQPPLPLQTPRGSEAQTKRGSPPLSDESTTDDHEDNDPIVTVATKATKSAPQSQRGIRKNTNKGLTSRAKENYSKSPELDAAPIGSKERGDSRAEQIASSKTENDPHDFKKRVKVGKIGGKAKGDPSDMPKTPHLVSSPHERAEPVQEGRSISRLEYPTLPTSPATKKDERSQVQAKPESHSHLPTETEKERADRNRENIKRDLEAKAAAPTKKKQRRF